MVHTALAVTAALSTLAAMDKASFRVIQRVILVALSRIRRTRVPHVRQLPEPGLDTILGWRYCSRLTWIE